MASGSGDERASRVDGPIESGAVLRILDANRNRALEGLRVAEEFARFLLDNKQLAGLCKDLRHRLNAQLRTLVDSQALVHRQVLADVGTALTTDSESYRPSAESVCRANLQRAKEAVRVLEEYAKVGAPAVAAGLESIRYELYDLEQRLLVGQRLARLLAAARLYVLIDAGASPDDFRQRVEQVLEGGADAIQLRDKQCDDRTLVERAQLLRELTSGANCLMIVNDRPDIARLALADGVHVGQDELTCWQVRSVCGRSVLVGLSTHNLSQVESAASAGADYIGVGPVFPSRTKTFAATAGPRLVADATERATIPWFAIGGIDAEVLPQLVEVGCCRIAVSQAIWQAADVKSAARRLKNLLPPLPSPGNQD
jgi:thiamine-phosphate pyrophosphorylase